MSLQSIYYFHCDEDLLAWRAIGIAAREALVLGMHRKESLFAAFPDEKQRSLATRIFWCIYALDRRWSFGTSLSFALQEDDIDPELPEPVSHATLSHGDIFQHLTLHISDVRIRIIHIFSV